MYETQHIALDLVAWVMLVSGLAKAFDIRAFRRNLQFLPYLPIRATFVVAYGLPLVEVLLACALYLNAPVAKVLTLVLLGLFCVVTFMVLHKGLRVPCNCFGSRSDRVFSLGVLWQDLGLMALVLWTFPLESRSLRLESPVAAACILLLSLSATGVWDNRKKMALPVGCGSAKP